MLTVDYARLGVRSGDRLLDLGCGFGRHAYQAARLGAEVVAFDAGADEVRNVLDTFGAMAVDGELDLDTARVGSVQGDALALPFADGSFDRVIASEVLEHIPDDEQAMAELARVLRPGGIDGRDRAPLRSRVRQLGALRRVPQRSRRPRPHLPAEPADRPPASAPGCGPPAATTPTACTPPTGGSAAWWDRPTTDHPAVSTYHRLLVWDIEKAPKVTRYADRVLNPLVGKSLVVYLDKPTHGQAGGPTASPGRRPRGHRARGSSWPADRRPVPVPRPAPEPARPRGGGMRSLPRSPVS